ncbi:MAG: hypothetical protein ACJ79K_03895 [Gemmatimonadaceae bacterium]
MRLTNRVAPTTALVLAIFSLAGCVGDSGGGGSRDTVRLQAYSEPVGEADDESAEGPPTVLGGPFGKGVETGYAGHTLPLSSVALEDNMSDADLVGYLNKLVYDLNLENGQLILADCTKKGKACVNEAAPIFIQPEVGMNKLDVKTIDAKGIVVARLINYDVDGRKDRGFHIPASSRAWWVVRLGSNNELESLFIARDFSQAGQVKVTKLRRARFDPCPDHPPDPSRPSMARWWDCGSSKRFAPRPPVKTAAATSYLQFVSNRGSVSAAIGAAGDTAMIKEGSTWITCSLGCCVAQ